MSEQSDSLGDEKYWAALARLPEIGSASILRLHDRFEDMSLAWTATNSELVEAGIAPRQAVVMVEERRRIDPSFEMDRVESANARIITFASSSFPPLLKEIPSPPAVLYARGSLTDQDLN